MLHMLHTLRSDLRTLCAGFALALGVALPAAASAAEAPLIRVYAIDCGRADFQDMGMFADTGEYDGKPGHIVDPCFLIRHPQGTLLWDTGLGDGIAAHKDGVAVDGGIHLYVDHTLVDQLKQIGLAPDDVNLLAFSHFHFDHTGNANLFPHATWIINEKELAWATATPTPFAAAPESFSAYKNAKTRMIAGDTDVFGDGSVRILAAPGHTPGHQVLELKLKKAGVVILGGDLYHTRANREFHRVPPINTERADTLASIDRIERIVKNTHARFVIQHAPEDFAALPRFPAYLE